MEFNCTSCGLCCKRIGAVITDARAKVTEGCTDPLTVEVSEFPYEVDEKGACSKLLPDNSCAVYATRPLLCSVKDTWYKYYRHKLPKVIYFSMAEEGCRIIQREEAEGQKEPITAEPVQTYHK